MRRPRFNRSDDAQLRVVREQLAAERRRRELDRLEAAAAADGVDYGNVDLTSDSVRAAAQFDHQHGIVHRGLKGCACQQPVGGDRR